MGERELAGQSRGAPKAEGETGGQADGEDEFGRAVPRRRKNANARNAGRKTCKGNECVTQNNSRKEENT